MLDWYTHTKFGGMKEGMGNETLLRDLPAEGDKQACICLQLFEDTASLPFCGRACLSPEAVSYPSLRSVTK
ncbi:hypothetical protein [Aneurinibacillus migulanus]|uniref:hypothetical protein n=1 Tax=Aneurinibacillus migulanus TaxID=47500 RepID=UPI001F2E1891|nr:hypothetical protein [Aneurinibacillus migulanus]